MSRAKGKGARSKGRGQKTEDGRQETEKVGVCAAVRAGLKPGEQSSGCAVYRI